MTVQLTCPWCQDEVDFEVHETADELVCSACSIRIDFAPDPTTTFNLLYGQAAA
jgi:DNA-directed RNA polymerase subunit RPC12/RpoP